MSTYHGGDGGDDGERPRDDHQVLEMLPGGLVKQVEDGLTIDRNGQYWKRGRKYSPEAKAVALAALATLNGNLKQTSRMLDMALPTLKNLARDPAAVDPRMVEEARRTLGDMFENIVLKAATVLAQDEIIAEIAAGPNPEKLAVVMGIADDKRANARGDGATNAKATTLAEYLAGAAFEEPPTVEAAEEQLPATRSGE